MEDQDYWKYSGIERDVYLYARPQSRVKDFKLTTELINQYKDGDFDVNITLNQPQQGQRVEFKLLDAKVILFTLRIKKLKQHRHIIVWQKLLKDALAWTAETPNLYTLVVNTFDQQGKPMESFAHPFGFRTVEMKTDNNLLMVYPYCSKE